MLKPRNLKIRNPKDSDTTSVSDVMSVHSDSDLIDVDFSENSLDVKSNDEGYVCNKAKDMSDCAYIKQPTVAENILIPDHDDKLVARSYVPVRSIEQKTDGTLNTKLEYETDKTGNNPSNSATICDNIDSREPGIPQSCTQ